LSPDRAARQSPHDQALEALEEQNQISTYTIMTLPILLRKSQGRAHQRSASQRAGRPRPRIGGHLSCNVRLVPQLARSVFASQAVANVVRITHKVMNPKSEQLASQVACRNLRACMVRSRP